MNKNDNVELKQFEENMKREHIITISCIIPRSIKQISEIWGYTSLTLYEPIKKLLEQKRISWSNEKEWKQGKEKFYQTNYDDFFIHLRNISEHQFTPFSDNVEELKELYKHGLKDVLSAENLQKLFVTRYNASEHYIPTLPIALYFMPICIGMIQHENNTTSHNTMVNNIAWLFFKKSKISLNVRDFLLHKSIELKNLNVDVKTIKILYKRIRGLEDLQVSYWEEEFIRNKLKNPKYRFLEE